MRPISDAGPKGRWPYQKLSSERASSNGAPPLAMRAMTLAKPVRSAPALQWMRMGSERPSRRSMSATRSGREGSLSGIRSRLRKSTPCRSATSSSRRYQWRSSFSPLRFRMDLSPCRRFRSSSSSGESWPLRYTRSGTTARKLSPKREAPSVRRLRTTRPPRDPTAAFLVIAALFYAAFLRESRRTRAMAHGVPKDRVLELLSLLRTSKHQASAAHVAPSHESRGEPQPGAEDRKKNVGVLRGRDAPQKDHGGSGPRSLGEVSRVSIEWLA